MGNEWEVVTIDGEKFTGVVSSENGKGFVFEDVTLNGDYIASLYIPSSRIKMMYQKSQNTAEQKESTTGQVRLTEGGQN